MKLISLGKFVYNDRLRDLYTINKNGKVDNVFEIKSNPNRQSIYTAIGQLFLNNLYFKKVTRFVVLPEEIDIELIKDFELIDIKTITFKWKNNEAVFKGLGKVKIL